MWHGRAQLVFLMAFTWACAMAPTLLFAEDAPVVGPVAPDASESSTATLEEDPIAAWMDSTATESSETTRRTLRRPLVADPEVRASSEAREATVSKGTDPLSMLWPLLVILVLITGGAFLARKWLPKSGRLGGGGAIKVLNRHYLSSKQSLCLVRLGGRVVLLGITPDRISMLTEIRDPEEVSGMVASEERSRPGSFTSSLTEFVSGRDRKNRLDDVKEPESAGRSVYSVSMETLARTDASVQGLSRRIRALSERNASAEPTS